MTNSPLRFVKATFELLDAPVDDPPRLERLLGASIAEDWAGFPKSLPGLRSSYASGAGEKAWGTLLILLDEPRTLVGLGGYKGEPSAEGVVEIGYAIAPAFRGRGLATESVRRMVRGARADTKVRAVDAHTLAQANPSVRVLEKLGFQRIGQQENANVGPLWHWRFSMASDPSGRILGVPVSAEVKAL